MDLRRMVGKALGLGLLMVIAVLVLSACGGGGKAGSTVSREGDEVDQIRDIERQRLRALVEADMDVARRLHADDFQLITPFGDSLSKEEYLGTVESGDIDYVVWKPDAIDVRLSGDMAVLRYSSHIEIIVQGRRLPPGNYWHTDYYEKRNGRWQDVWSQATEMQ
jgi:Domain of unknown function (DUF4440)